MNKSSIVLAGFFIPGKDIKERTDMKSLVDWRKGVGVSSATVWRWRQRGWLTVTNIAGKCYISEDAEKEFERRAAAGEFARQPVVPSRHKEAA